MFEENDCHNNCHKEEFDYLEEEFLEFVFAAFALNGIVARGEITNPHEMALTAWKIGTAMVEKGSGKR